MAKVGLWLIGAFGGVGTTTAVGIAALARDRGASVGMVSALPEFEHLKLDPAAAFVVGGHDIRGGSFEDSAAELNRRAGMFTVDLLNGLKPTLETWSLNVRPGIMLRPDDAMARLADRPDAVVAKSPREAITRIQKDLKDFAESNQLSQLVVVNVASTEPPFETTATHQKLETLDNALDQGRVDVLPTSSLYAYATMQVGFAYVNLTPSTGATLPALEELSLKAKVPHAGQDAKTGETLLKSVLAPMFAKRNLKVLSWVGHNILGNRDGLVLSDPANKSSKVKSKDSLLGELLGYKPQSHVSIEYIESLDDWKTAWDHIHFEGFLGTKMTLQFTWQGCDSILAAPLVIDLARFVLHFQRERRSGMQTGLACFFKSPLGVKEHDFAKQFEMLVKDCKPFDNPV